jgi:type IV secretory pathway VirB3-like protein
MNTLLFEEDQYFRQSWLWALLLGILGLLTYVAALAPPDNNTIWVVVGGFVVLNLLFYFMRLSVEVDTEALHIRFFPFLRKTIPVTDVVHWEARTYRPLAEYGGWGIRYACGKGWAYNVSGNQGVQLQLANGKRILIGSQRAQELARAIGGASGRLANV